MSQPRGLFHFLFRLLRCKTRKQRDDLLRLYAFENWLRMPMVYTDQYDLQYVLYPGQNAQVYLENHGNYEVAETRFCLRFVRPGMLALDVGAHIGLYTLLLAKSVGDTGQVHAFEAESKNYQRLATNVALNRFDNVTLSHSAVYSESGQVQLNVFPESVNAWHSLGCPTLLDPYHPGEALSPVEQQEVVAVTLDDYCRSAGIEHVDLLKIDVEGAELDVLKGAKRLLGAGRIAAVLFEVSLPQVEILSHQPAEIFALLRQFGLRSFSLSEDGLIERDVECSTVLYQNFVALRDESTIRQLSVSG